MGQVIIEADEVFWGEAEAGECECLCEGFLGLSVVAKRVMKEGMEGVAAEEAAVEL